jgi:hypothetical protein
MNDANKHSDILNRLRFFNEKGTRLWDSAFMKGLINQKSGWKFGIETLHDGSLKALVSISGPDIDAIEGFVLNFRFFIQDNEKTSFREMHKLYSSISLSQDLKSRFDVIRNELNAFLDSELRPKCIYNKIPLTNREVMMVFIYGGLAHATKVDKYKELMSIFPLNVVLPNGFNMILVKVLNAISAISALNDHAILELTEKETKIYK